MAAVRTDLAEERAGLWQETGGAVEGYTLTDTLVDGFPVVRVEVNNQTGAEALGKPVGSYVTVDLSPLADRAEDGFARAVEAVAQELAPLLALGPGDCVLVAGLGNRAVTPDGIGPGCLRHVLVTRHLGAEKNLPFRPVAAVAPGVLGETGMESSELVAAAVQRCRPAAVIAVDALAAREMRRLCTTIQISNTGITPGSGVGNARKALDRATLGVPVVAVGVPTVVDGATLSADLMRRAGLEPPEELGEGCGLMVTPRDIDERVREMCKVLGFAIDRVLQPGLSLSELELLTQ